MWDERYSAKEYVYGTEPNGFLAAKADVLPLGRILCLAEGEGRNAVLLCEQGQEVTAVDASPSGREKPQPGDRRRSKAARRQVRIDLLSRHPYRFPGFLWLHRTESSFREPKRTRHCAESGPYDGLRIR